MTVLNNNSNNKISNSRFQTRPPDPITKRSSADILKSAVIANSEISVRTLTVTTSYVHHPKVAALQMDKSQVVDQTATA